jgi:hypothetical protein
MALFFFFFQIRRKNFIPTFKAHGKMEQHYTFNKTFQKHLQHCTLALDTDIFTDPELGNKFIT